MFKKKTIVAKNTNGEHEENFIADIYIPISVKFALLAEQWKNETAYLSSINKITENRHYQKIIALGKDVLPYIFAYLQKEPDLWFTALYKLTGINPVDTADAGNIPKMTEAWIKWGKENGYINKEALKPCPFCAGKAMLIKNDYSGMSVKPSDYDVACSSCGARIEGLESRSKAFELWNIRIGE